MDFSLCFLDLKVLIGWLLETIVSSRTWRHSVSVSAAQAVNSSIHQDLIRRKNEGES